MQIPVDEVNHLAIALVPADELDASNVAEFKNAIAPILQAHAEVIRDLSRLRFVDSSGMGAILSCLRQLTAKGGELKLCGMTDQVRAIFVLVRMHRIFDIYATPQEAVHALAH
jgi:anti-sigma B factor antagonist